MLARWLMDAWHDGTEDYIMFDYVCPEHAAPVGSNDDDAETSTDKDGLESDIVNLNSYLLYYYPP